MIIQWKQRLYAFLLRRVLGPLLDDESLKKLHQSIEISLKEGSFALNDVSLNTSYLAAFLAERLPTARIRKARIRRLEIHLTLQEHSAEDGSLPSSLAWRAINLGSTTTAEGSPTVSLMAHVEIDGVVIEIESGPSMQPPTEAPEADSASSETQEPPVTRSLLFSYVDAALSSLRLTLKINNLQVRFCTWDSLSLTESWLEYRVKSLSYHDVQLAPLGKEAAEYETVMQKAVDFTRMTILVGETVLGQDNDEAKQDKAASYTSTIALLEGTSRFCLRAIEYNRSQRLQQGYDTRQLQQDVEINLDQRLNLSVDEASLLQVQKILRGFQSASTNEVTKEIVPDRLDIELIRQDSSADEADLSTMDGIMRQYQAARLLVERKEVRGGILIPTTATEDGGVGHEVTFDAFFDANEYSFSRYSTVLRESVLLAEGDVTDQSFVHSKIRFCLKGGGIKVLFRSAAGNSDGYAIDALPNRIPNEYMLLTFNDLNLSASLSLQAYDFQLSVVGLDIEDSQKAQSYGKGDMASAARRAEIGSVLHFSPTRAENDALDESNILLEAPCLSLHVKVKYDGELRQSDVELNLEPFEITYRHLTIANLARLVKSMRKEREIEVGPEHSEVHSESQSPAEKAGVRVHIYCHSIEVIMPLSVDAKERGALYDRCGFDAGGSLSTSSSLGVVCEQLSIEWGNEDSHDQVFSLSCHHILAFASSPSGMHTLERKQRHFDIFAVSGLTQVHPVIPIAIHLYRKKSGESDDGDHNHGRACFPVVPMISSFKARQEDEDEDNRIDRVLSSKLQELETDIRKGLRANDPQSAMILEASISDLVVDIYIPEFIGDLSSDEVLVLKEMLESIKSTIVSRSSAKKPGTAPTRLGLSLRCDSASLTMHQSAARDTLDGYKPPSFSYATKIDRLKTHFLIDGARLRHARTLAHEVDFFEITDPVKSTPSSDALCSLLARLRALRDRNTTSNHASVTPIFHRSHIFSPISRQSPSFLLDVINVTSTGDAADLDQKNVHLTLYDTTYRFDFDSGWASRLHSVFNSLQKEGTSDEEPRKSSSAKTFAPVGDVSGNDRQAEKSSVKTLTRIFLSIADCNIDYASSSRFKTSSRTIVRVGDFRLSSNLVLPAPPIQAFTVSLGDLSVYLCPRRYHYKFENSRLFHSASSMKSQSSSQNAEGVLREMNYRTILMLDSVDAIIAVANLKPGQTLEPEVRSNITVGEVSLFGCKDSFARFVETIGELQAELTALDVEAVAVLRASSEARSALGLAADEMAGERDQTSPEHPTLHAFDDLKKQSALRPSAGTSTRTDREKQFLLDGYDWTTIDLDEANISNIPPGEEQVARWYATSSTKALSVSDAIGLLPGQGIPDTEGQEQRRESLPHLKSHHFPLNPVSDPLADGDMGAAKYAGTQPSPLVKNRTVIHDLTVKLRFFDGYDWPELLSEEMKEAPRKGAFLIDQDFAKIAKYRNKVTKNIIDTLDDKDKAEKLERKAMLMGNLLEGAPENETTFHDLPLPEERGKLLKEQAAVRRLARRTGKYLQVYASGVSLRLDSHRECNDHRLISCMDVAAQDFFLAETISSDRPVKMLGEWVNEVDHPRETRGGIMKLKLVSWHPMIRVTPENEIASDECQAALTLLPLRCILDQRAIRFARAFFSGDTDTDKDGHSGLPPGLYAVPSPLFRTFHVNPIKLKIDYSPQKVDTQALRDGAVVELINISPLEGMILTLTRVEIENVVGFGSVAGLLIGRWIEHICQTQLLKFLTNTRALEPVSNVGGGVADMVILPWEAFQNGESIQKALRSGISSFTRAVTYETLTTTSRFAHYVAGGVAEVSSRGSGMSSLPSRPLNTPRTILDTTPHVVESLARGLQTASYKVVIIPYREYHRTGTRGAVTSVIKGIPVALAAPASGAVEAISFALLGARNQIRPDIRKEEEASQKGLHFDG